MESMNFEILIGGEKQLLKVIEIDNDSFELFNDDKRLGVIYFEFNDEMGLSWRSRDLIAPSIIEQIGDRIEAINS